MASVIEEIPIESTPVAEVDLGAEEAQASAPPEPAAKKRGRPKGSKNRVKEPPAPRAVEPAPKKKPRAAAAPPSSESEEELPPTKAKKTKKRAPAADSSEDDVPQQPVDSRAIAAEVLQMLSQRHLDLRQAKREKYRSWFQS